MKKLIVIGAAVFLLSVLSISAFAASVYNSPAEAVAGLTGRTVEDVTKERTESGKSYGAIANDAGKLDEFKKETQEIRKDILAEKVADGTITQDQADDALKAFEERQAFCDGTGSGNGGCGGNRNGAGRAQGQSRGWGAGNGMGMLNV